MKNNNKKFGLAKERELKKKFQIMPGVGECVRARGSFGNFDLIVFWNNSVDLISIKSVRQKYWSPNTEINKLSKVKVPSYCNKVLWVYWSRHKDRPELRGWKAYPIK